MRVSLVDRPTQLGLAVQSDEARYAVIRRAMDKYLLIVQRVHGIEELLNILKLRCCEVDGNVTVLHAEGFNEPPFVGEAIAWIEQAEINDYFKPGLDEFVKLIF